MNHKLAYRPEEVAELLGLSRSKVYEIMNSGELHSYKDGKRRLCSLSALVKYQELKERGCGAGERQRAVSPTKEMTQ
ncbi:helix-turn-helix domain-containing protein [Stenotrophomonas lactitubi]|uniref:helix-turn-helix domain-containing protein n=1 Tax=Stenotrophomonas lactitubi TaxID=2045214 RepID=UPI001DA2E956|nr:helix-turn-helix domain-containing protein [Stenotrophomonas lactitubi]CAH0138172.1 hypothetical protein SRABI122_00398 [Stenotrophomonas lactitubi]CAH0153403.1 hypothetical protein SRABI66_00772 [Stenotrophomonas lactitubi]CAH0170493.1 hypothetical protein SRABI81_01199 [Stenotrophomonas lactitubi]CAH0206052.1 hypothetical protein SRABI102_01895 [Stenotrophomonas lactitubi]